MPYQVTEKHPAPGPESQAPCSRFLPLTPGGLALVLVSLLSGCASPTRAPEGFEPPVYPPPPDEPRFVYERTLRVAEDVQKLTGFEKLRLAATGKSPVARGLVKPYGVAVRQGRVYVTDTAQRAVLLFDMAAGRYRQFGEQEPGALIKPTGIAVSPTGEVFVADTSARRIRVYDPDGAYLRTLGNDELLTRPSGVALSPDGRTVYVVDVGGVDTNHHRVQVFDAQTGQHQQTIGTRGREGGQFNLPLQAATAPDGTLYVVDGGNFRVQAFTAAGGYVFSFGRLGRFPGQFARPKGIATDRNGNIYVVDAAFGNVQLFNPKGQVLMFIGRRARASSPGQFSLPAGVAVDEGGRVYVVDQFFRKIDIFRPVGPDTATPP
ncbi:MAG TPA: 6-bladed beta-propeller [Gammaproteobacteria bacterium]|nr:6-bladed beta-propeller [Gammaproteobacteria bacterium]